MAIPYKLRALGALVAIAAVLMATAGTVAGRTARGVWEAHTVAAVTAAPPIVAVSPPVNRRPNVRPPYSLILPDCESDNRTLPCVTVDESQWRIIYAYGGDGYTYRAVRKCRNRYGMGTPLPCVWPAGGESFRVFARSLDIG